MKINHKLRRGTLRVVLQCFLCFFLASCGRMEPPRPPEVYSPKAVEELETVADLEGVLFRWEAPDQGRDGKELRSMGGYYIYRKEVKRESDLFDDDVEYELLATVEDTHIKVRDDLREKAKAEGKVSRRVKVDDKLLKFEYRDSDVKAGHSYLYKIVPFNQGDVEGQVKNYVRVGFRGDASEVQVLEGEEDDFGTFTR